MAHRTRASQGTSGWLPPAAPLPSPRAAYPGQGGLGLRYGLVSQAGVAIGLATIVAEAYPERGPQIRTLFLAVMAINQTLGPILFRHALDRSGEIVSVDAEEEDEATLAPPERLATARE